jgi:hypothetical protein
MDYTDKLKEVELELENTERELREMENNYFKEIREANANENDYKVYSLLYDLKYKRKIYNTNIKYLKRKQNTLKKKVEKKHLRNIIYIRRNNINI